MAPVSAVIEERRARQSAQAERDRLATENAALKQVKDNWDLVEPYLPLLASHPKITGKAAPAAPASPAQDPELVKAAKVLGFYDADGQPDTERAREAREMFTGVARGVTEEAIRPVANNAATARAQALRDRAHTVVDKAGRPFAQREHIDAVLDSLSPELQAQPEMVQTALLIARGMGGPAAGEPLHTENVGGVPGANNKQLSPVERAAARARGLSDESWIKARDTSSNVLE